MSKNRNERQVVSVNIRYLTVMPHVNIDIWARLNEDSLEGSMRINCYRDIFTNQPSQSKAIFYGIWSRSISFQVPWLRDQQHTDFPYE